MEDEKDIVEPIAARKRGRPTRTRWAIWWLDPPSWQVAKGSGFVEQLPRYLQDAFEQRGGRAGRKRLWPALPGAPNMTSVQELEHWGDGDWGGIVFDHSDRAKLAFAPGFVTDLNGFFVAGLTNTIYRDYPARDSGIPIYKTELSQNGIKNIATREVEGE